MRELCQSWGRHRGRATRCGRRRLGRTGKLPLAAADGAGVLVVQPRVDAHEVEIVRTLRTPSAGVLRAGVRRAQGWPARRVRRRTLPQTTGESSPGPGAPGAQPSSAMWQIPHTSSSEVQVQLATAAAHAHKPGVRMRLQTQTQECGVRTVPVFDLDPHLSPHATVAHGVVERVSQSYSLGVWSWDSGRAAGGRGGGQLGAIPLIVDCHHLSSQC